MERGKLLQIIMNIKNYYEYLKTHIMEIWKCERNRQIPGQIWFSKTKGIKIFVQLHRNQCDGSSSEPSEQRKVQSKMDSLTTFTKHVKKSPKPVLLKGLCAVWKEALPISRYKARIALIPKIRSGRSKEPNSKPISLMHTDSDQAGIAAQLVGGLSSTPCVSSPAWRQTSVNLALRRRVRRKHLLEWRDSLQN